MVNSETTVEDFIEPISFCDIGCSVDSILSAIYSSDLGVVALVDSKQIPQGVIDSKSLLKGIFPHLGFIRKGNSASSDNLLSQKLAQFSFSEIWEKPIIFRADTLAIKFLSYLESEQLQSQATYLIVNDDCQLLGSLNTKELLKQVYISQIQQKFLDRKSAQNRASITSTTSKKNQETYLDRQSLSNTKTNSEFNACPMVCAVVNSVINSDQQQTDHIIKNNILHSLLDRVSLPLKLENTQGNTCYQNKTWQQLESNQNTGDLKYTNCDYSWQSDFNLPKKASRQTNYKFNLEQLKSSENHHHCQADNWNTLVFEDKKLQQRINQLNVSLLEESREIENSTANFQTKTITKQQKSNWYYYRLPLQIKEREITISDTPNYWLVFATDFSILSDLTFASSWQQNSKLQQLQDEFLLNASHDLKSPLTAIIGLSSLLKKGKLGDLNDNQIRFCQTIYHSGKKLINSINDFLDISRLTASRLKPSLESIDIEQICQQTYEKVTQKLQTIAITTNDINRTFPELQFDLASDAVTAIADKNYLTQIIARFLENALLLTTPDSLLGIATEHLSNWLSITVWHEGGGLSETQQNLSAPEFFESQNLLTSQEKNQGYGLMLAQQLAQAHGGDISLISQDNYGSEFTLFLPLNPDCYLPYDNHTFDEVEKKPKEDSLVLIVDTSSVRIIDLSEKLKTLGYYCAIARSHTETLYKADRLKPGKIILNLSCLESFAENTITTLKYDQKTSNIPLVLVQDSSMRSTNTDLTELELTDIVSYPTSRATLARLFPPMVSSDSDRSPARNLTVLRLSVVESPEKRQKKASEIKTENLTLDFVLENPSFSLSHHIIEADSIEQASLLARIWNIDVIIWDGANLEFTAEYLQEFARSDILASTPIITLEARDTEAANSIGNLSVFPCLLPANERSIQQLTQVIQIAAGFS